MPEVKAFVGHSFTDDDKTTVGHFTDFFESLAKVNTSFSWTHARVAEPKQLAQKVLALCEDRNLFIGICTKKELVTSDEPTPLFGRLISKPNSFEWKTSDWIIQEIGLAVSRRMDLILLIEKGVRPPGGLQGNIEYIEFTRNAPEKAFTRITEMVTAALGVTVTASSANLAATVTAPPVEAEAPSSNGSDIVPTAEWDDDDFEFAQFRCILRGADTEPMKEAYLKLPGEPREMRENVWAARKDSIRLSLGKGGDLDNLRKLMVDHPSSGTIKDLYGRALETFDKYETAAPIYVEAANQAKREKDRCEYLAKAVLAYERSGASIDATRVSEQLKEASLAYGHINGYYKTLEKLAEIRKDKDLSVGSLEAQIDDAPADFRKRFALAYLHSELGNQDLALHHYLQIPSEERQSMDWNNLAASYNHFKINARAITAFRKSESMGETLAMANLGYKLLQAGFVDEANDICERALRIEEFHKNVGQLSIALREQRENETKAVHTVLGEAKSRIEFYTLFGRALGLGKPNDRTSRAWVTPSCIMTLEVEDDWARLTGSFEREADPFNALIGITKAKSTVHHQIEYFGRLRGRTVVGTVKRISDEKATGSLLADTGTESQKFLMVISDDEIRVLEPSISTAQPATFTSRVPSPLVAAT
jgi:tetratricopeptide (TPR) repeat protein